MEIVSALHNLGALLTLGLGGLGLLKPAAAARFVNLEPRGAVGRSEIRATYGGFFAALGAFAIASQDIVAFTMLGAAWVAAAAARLLSTFLDDRREPAHYGGVLFEGTIGLLLLAPG